MKYNRSEIMKRAWELKRLWDYKKISFGRCLSHAWDEAKQAVAESAYTACKFINGMEITMLGVTRTLNRWTKNNMDRVYINYGRKNDGYVDLKTGNLVGGNSYSYLAKIYNAILTMQF